MPVAAHLPLRKRRQFVARVRNAEAVRVSLTETSARDAPAVKRYRCAMAGTRCRSSISQSDDDIADIPDKQVAPLVIARERGLIQYAVASRLITGASGILDRPVSLTRFALLPGD